MPVFFALIPLIAFYVAESWYGLRAGVFTAIVFSGVHLAWEGWSTGRLNRLVLFSAMLVVGLGGLSLLSEDERFVLWTPVIGDGVFAAVLLGGMLTTPALHETALREADPTVTLDAPARAALRGVVLRLAVNLLLHGAVTAWSTTQPRETWLFVSGPVQYAQFALQGVGEFLWRRWRPLPPVDPGEAM